MCNLKEEREQAAEKRKEKKQEKKQAKLQKFLAKTKITHAPKKERAKLVFDDAEKLPEGEKKSINTLTGQLNPKQVESNWHSWWEKKGFFTPNISNLNENENENQLDKSEPVYQDKVFCMMLPPPNVTGTLHIGHAMMAAIQDSIVRRKRMQGYNTLYLPGTDHAGIATQAVVERSLEKEGKTRHILGRDKFLERVWEWKKMYGGQIVQQLKRLGASLDSTRERFTMDESLSAAVTEAFVRLYEAGLVYRGRRVVHWCAKLQTTLSDLEVEHIHPEKGQKIRTDGEEYEFGRIYTVKYAVKKEGKEIGTVNVCTTRPETIYGDCALCVHPKDKRYTEYLKENVFAVNPLTGENIPFIADEAAEIEFGTGIVKITPAHDPLDFSVGERHNLEFISVIDKNNRMTVAECKGMLRFAARKKTVEILKEKGSMVAEDPYDGPVPICTRTGEVVEPRVLPQWWMRCSEIAAKAREAVDLGELQILPKEMESTWRNWLTDTKDWCLSRQLWWGHRIPAYTRDGKWYVTRTKEEAEIMAGGKVEQEEDVLDTWFSSGLWPFATIGWPKETKEMKTFYPNTLMETGKDIVFFWVARMVMLGIFLTGKVPFKTVLFHSIVRDAHGEKMSKSKGNVIDPRDVIDGISLNDLISRLKSGNISEKEIRKAEESLRKEYPRGIEACGSDALRFALLSSASLGRDVNLCVDKVSSCRRFCNKLWNAMKFALAQKAENSSVRTLFGAAVDGWILTRMRKMIESVNKEMEKYNFIKATSVAQHFLLAELCDFYLEMYKGRKDTQGVSVLRYVSVEYIKIVHPFLPFITEEIYQTLQNNWKNNNNTDNTDNAEENLNPLQIEWKESVCIDKYPVPGKAFEEDEQVIETLVELIRNIRSSMKEKEKSAQVEILLGSKLTGSAVIVDASPVLERILGIKVSLVQNEEDGEDREESTQINFIIS